MAEASADAIQRLIENSKKGLAQIEKSLPDILETRQAVVNVIESKGVDDVVVELMLIVLDSILAEQEVIYDISTSLNSLLRASDDYTKRYYMQILNFCFWEACQLFAGEDDENGLLDRLEKLTGCINQAGCQFLIKHIINDIKEFREEYTDKELRNITRHYDDPIKMYEKQRGLINIDFYAKGVSQLLAIRMEVTVVSSFLLNLFATTKNVSKNVVEYKNTSLSLKEKFNEAIFKAFKEKNIKEVVQHVLSKGQKTLDDYYVLHLSYCKAIVFLEQNNYKIPDSFKKLESLILLRMEILFLRYDIACSVLGYLNAVSDVERSHNLRLIYITKQAALTHIYGYNEKSRNKSLWTRIKVMEEASNETLDTDKVEELLKDLTANLTEDKDKSNIFSHYRYKQTYYIPQRFKVFDKMIHHKELGDSLKLINVCNSLEKYSASLLSCLDDTQKKDKNKHYSEWLTILDDLVNNIGYDERAKETLRTMKELIDKIYGDGDYFKNKLN